MGTGREGGREGGEGGSALRSFRWHSTHTRTGYMERYRHIGASAHRGTSHASCIQHASLVLLQPPFCRPIHDRDASQEERKKNGHETTPPPTLAD